MRNKFAEVFYNLGKKDKKLCLIVADISPAGSISKFREEFPQRFVNTGVAEQIMIGMAAGMSQRGLKPFAYTIATFTLFRPYEFVRDDLCYQNLPVTIVGIGGGVTYSTLGATHHAMEDISLSRALPNMNVIAPCDPIETEKATIWCTKQNVGPVYLRLGKAGEPDLTSSAIEKWSFGKIRLIKSTGKDIAIIGYGPILKLAFDFSKSLNKGYSIYSASTLKPVDTKRLKKILTEYSEIVTIEETLEIGSLGQSIKVLAQEMQINKKIHSFNLQDKFIHCYGNHSSILKKHKLDVLSIKKKLNIK